MEVPQWLQRQESSFSWGARQEGLSYVSYKVCLMNCGPVFTCGTCQGSWSWLQWVVVMSIKYVAKKFNKEFVGRPGLTSKILASML